MTTDEITHGAAILLVNTPSDVLPFPIDYMGNKPEPLKLVIAGHAAEGCPHTWYYGVEPGKIQNVEYLWRVFKRLNREGNEMRRLQIGRIREEDWGGTSAGLKPFYRVVYDIAYDKGLINEPRQDI